MKIRPGMFRRPACHEEMQDAVARIARAFVSKQGKNSQTQVKQAQQPDRGSRKRGRFIHNKALERFLQ